MIFSYKKYRNFLQALKKKGPITTFSERDSQTVFLLRHDVDLDIIPAYKLAIIENEHDIKSTFFFLTTAETYNVSSKKNRLLIQKIKNMGHEIGLHFDPSLYGKIKKNLDKKVDEEAKILESIIGSKIKSISLHNPSVYNSHPLFKGYINAYDPKIFRDRSYISDSRMDFRGKDIYKFINNIENKPIQILLHPLHYSEKGGGYPDILWNYFYNHIKSVHRLFYANETYRKQLKKSIAKNIETQCRNHAKPNGTLIRH